MEGIREADWKLFRQLRETALERFCQRVLVEVDAVLRDEAHTHHERYLSVFRLVQERDEELDRAFDAPRRSQMLFQLARIHSLRLLEPSELTRFSPDVRQTVESLARGMRE